MPPPMSQLNREYRTATERWCRNRRPEAMTNPNVVSSAIRARHHFASPFLPRISASGWRSR